MISIMLDNGIAGYRDLFDGTLCSALAGMNIDSSSLFRWMKNANQVLGYKFSKR